MHNREITHIVKTDSLLKNQIGCKHQTFFLLPFERNKMQKLDLRLKIKIL